jgi:hypothetical protein
MPPTRKTRLHSLRCTISTVWSRSFLYKRRTRRMVSFPVPEASQYQR